MSRIARSGVGAALGMAVALSAATAPAQDGDPIAELKAQRFPGAELISESDREFDELALFAGPFEELYVPGETRDLEGRISQFAFQMEPERSTLEVYRAYGRGLEAMGLTKVFECKNRECGGSIGYVMSRAGFRIEANWNDQRYALYEDPARGVFVSLFVVKKGVSTPSGQFVYAAISAVVTDAVEAELEILSADEIAGAIASDGAATIYGLEFALDSAELQPASQPVLAEMAKYLSENPDAEIRLVGHTDSQGGLEYNMDLSRRRAEAVRAALISEFGVAPERLSAHGVGYLAPKASNADESGRARNRRVEMIEK